MTLDTAIFIAFAAYLLVLLSGVMGQEPHSPPNDIPADPDHPWIGRWVTVEGREQNFDNVIKALGNLDQYGHGHKVWHKLWREGDHFHHKTLVPSKNYKNDFKFKLGEETTSTYNGTEFKYKYTEQDKDLIAEYSVPARDKVLRDIYHVNGNELEKTYKIGEITAKRWYRRATENDKPPQ